MAFEFTARSVLQLGAELISSDAIALAELIKNSIDAGSPSGVQVDFWIVVPHADYEYALALLEDDDQEEGEDDEDRPDLVERARTTLLERVLSSAPQALRDQFAKLLPPGLSKEKFRAAAEHAYRSCNQIVVADEGHGMSLEDLRRIYLTIGTTSRAKFVRESARQGESAPRFLGEKGVGRLSVMRLGDHVRIETATKNDTYENELEIDWTRFEKADDLPARSVEVAPVRTSRRTSGASFTRIVITGLRSSWSQTRLRKVASDQLARLMDPFSWAGKRRFQIRLNFNDTTLTQTRVVSQELLGANHAWCSGTYRVDGGHPRLRITMESSLYNGPKTVHDFDLADLMAMTGLQDEGLPSAILRRLGPFTFQFYWFNRQRIRGLPAIGDRDVVKNLIKAWSGVALYRDGYRVAPYGDEGDDWLGLDRDALSASGYKLNTKQIIGRVSIGRTSNPKLLDQTNRQGLVDSFEKQALIMMLNSVISRWWRGHLNEANATNKTLAATDFDAVTEKRDVNTYEDRARNALKTIKTDYHVEESILQQVREAFQEVKEAHGRAIARIEAIEDEKERMTQLAGIGLMIEMIAHELTRATEATQDALKTIQLKQLDETSASSLKVLGQQVKVIKHRLQVLEPLSIPGRQRRVHLNLHDIVSYVLTSHAEQFRRHEISMSFGGRNKDVTAFAIEGHVVQILENLIHNSVYWLKLEKAEHPRFKPEIEISIRSNPPRIRFADNGPGIPTQRAQSVFEPFFSTKSGGINRRRGLGLYIARQNAEQLQGTLELIDRDKVRENRFNIFELTLLESAP